MLRRYCVSEKTLIPYSENRYSITVDGIITDKLTNKTISDSTSNVEIVLFKESRIFSIAWLMAISFKPMYKAESFVTDWTVLFADGNDKNFHPGNLIWQPPIKGQVCPELKNFYIIPGFSAFAISKDGKVYGRKIERLISTRLAKPDIKNSYANFTTRTDNDYKSTVGLHRALGLAFLPYSNDVWKMTVNHRDGIKNNNDLSNLEWATYSENNLHAKDMGLNNTRRITLLKDHQTGDIINFISLSHAADYLEMNSGWLLDCIRAYPNKPIQFRYSAQFEDSVKTWPMFSKEELGKIKNARKEQLINLECMATNIYTKHTLIANGPSELSRYVSMTKDQTKTALNSPHPWPVNNYIFSYLVNQRAERKFETDELETFANKIGIKNPIRVTKSDGTTKVYTSPSEFSVLLNLPIREMADKIYAGKGKYCTDEFCVEYIS